MRDELQEALNANGVGLGPIYSIVWAQAIGVNCAMVLAYLLNLAWKIKNPQPSEDGSGYLLDIDESEFWNGIGMSHSLSTAALNKLAFFGVVVKHKKPYGKKRRIALFPGKIREFIKECGGFWTRREEIEFHEMLEREHMVNEDVFAKQRELASK